MSFYIPDISWSLASLCLLKRLPGGGGGKGTQQILKREATPRQAPGPEV